MFRTEGKQRTKGRKSHRKGERNKISVQALICAREMDRTCQTLKGTLPPPLTATFKMKEMMKFGKFSVQESPNLKRRMNLHNETRTRGKTKISESGRIYRCFGHPGIATASCSTNSNLFLIFHFFLFFSPFSRQSPSPANAACSLTTLISPSVVEDSDLLIPRHFPLLGGITHAPQQT